MTKKLTRSLVENAFLPAREITDPERFAGRRTQVDSCYLAMLAEGTSMALLGNRGMGKTSLARQVVSLASGSVDLLERYEIEHERPLDFLAIYFTCGSDIQNTQHLLERLLTSQDCLAPWVYYTPSAAKTMSRYQPKFGANIFGLELGLAGEKSTEVSSVSAAPPSDVYAVFTNVLSAIASSGAAKDGILIVVDEFDQIPDKNGFASFLKALATNVPKCRFCIVGVAQDLQGLIEEHKSADRLFAGGVVPVPDMTPDELSEIIDLAETHVSNEIVFDVAARSKLVEGLANGHPYMVHLIGKHALRRAYITKQPIVTVRDIDETLRHIAESGADPVLEKRYKTAVASSGQREAVLRALAKFEKAGEVWTGDAYPEAIASGVDNPSQYVGSLVTQDYGAEVVKVRDRYYRFRDSLFKTYVSVRPSQYSPEASVSQSEDD